MPSAKRFAGALLAMAALAVLCPVVNSITISNQTVTNTEIPFERLSPNGTTIQFTIDVPADFHVDVRDQISGIIVTTIDQTFAGAGAQNLFWSAYWLIGNAGGRKDGFYSLTLTATAGGTSDIKQINSLVHIGSIDIHGVTILPSFDSQGLAGPPYTISYQLAKAANVTATITNSSGTVVRTLVNNRLQVDETVSSNTIVWDGLADTQQTVPLGLYTLKLSAIDTTTGDHSFTVSNLIAVTSLAGAATDPQKLFEDNTFVFPNPVRNGQGTFQLEAIRDNANMSLKIYTLTGDLVREQTYNSLPAGTITDFVWDTTNQAGRKVGRGLYYYVVREEDAQGTLQTVKKMAVIQ